MKKLKFSSSELFKKLESDKFDGLGSVFGGISTEQTKDTSTSDADCTNPNCGDSTSWSKDSTDSTDSTQRHLDGEAALVA